MIQKDPVNVWVMDVPRFIKEHNCGEVKSNNIFLASTNDFHPEGLFSEEIFGQIGTPERLTRFGFIDLNTRIFHPHIYSCIITLKQLYAGIIEGTAYAKFDKEVNDFVACKKDDMEGDTGYSFFLEHIEKVKFEKSASIKRNDKIKILEKYRKFWFIEQFLVEPAQLRDIKNENGNISQEEINKLYGPLLSLSRRIVKGSNNPIYDSIRANVQKKAYEIYLYIKNLLDGKHAYAQGPYSHRRIISSTRNVISAVTLDHTNIDDPQAMQYNEVKSPLFQTMKAAQIVVMHYIKTLVLDGIFTQGATSIPLIDTKTLDLKYVDMDDLELQKYTTNDGLDDMINGFKNIHVRHRPIKVKGADKKYYYLYMVHDNGKEVALFRNKKDLIELLGEENVKDENIRPLTWAEMMYLCTFRAVEGKHGYTTRYPIGQGPDSCYPAKLHLVTTSPSKVVSVINQADPEGPKLLVPHYPVKGAEFIDSYGVHPGRHVSLASDHDGDTTSFTIVMAEEANRDIDNFLKSKRALITPKKELLVHANTANIKFTIYNLTYNPTLDKK